MVSSRSVERSSCDLRHAHLGHVARASGGRARRAGLRACSRVLRAPRADLLEDLARVDGRAHAAVDREQHVELLTGRLRPPRPCRDIAACRRAARRRASVARCTCPSEAAAAGLRSKLPKRLCQSGPSSACMRRLTKAAPIGGASLCSFCSASAYSGGSASGMVAKSCATFMIGPFEPAERLAQRRRIGRVRAAAEQAGARHAGRDAAHIGADPRIAGRAGREAVVFSVAHRGPPALPCIEMSTRGQLCRGRDGRRPQRDCRRPAVHCMVQADRLLSAAFACSSRSLGTRLCSRSSRTRTQADMRSWLRNRVSSRVRRIMPAIRSSPIVQNPGSWASRPNGASRSL